MSTRLLIVLVLVSPVLVFAADPIIIRGPEQASLDLKLPGGGLAPARGVANIQVFRASRGAAGLADGKGWTYHHHVDLAAWKGRLYLAWNSTEKDEDIWPSRELYATSSDGSKWSPPAELFPQGVSTGSRMYFFHAPNGRMLTVAGLRTTQEQMTERKKGAIVVREIRGDHTLGDIFTLRPPTNPNHPHLPPPYRDAADAAFVQACDQLLANKPFLEQADYGHAVGDARMKWHDVNAWPADEPSRPHFDRFGKAMAFYHRRDGALVAVMKWGWVLVSHDEGRTWTPPVRPPTLVAGMAKSWGQRTGDGRYALLYNPHLEHRYPLVIVSGDDGITFGDMRVVHGDVPPLRYPGLHKSPGPQYVRGISEWSSDGSWNDADNALWVCYSVNKEDVWVSRLPLPIPLGNDRDAWNTYSPRWAPVSITDSAGGQVVQLEDRDPADFARATRLLPAPAPQLDVSFEVRGGGDKNAREPLHIEFVGPRSRRAAAFALADNLTDDWSTVRARLDCSHRKATIEMANGEQLPLTFAEPVEAIEAISFRTGERAAPPSAGADRPTGPTRYQLRNLKINPR